MAFVKYQIEKPDGGWIDIEIDEALPAAEVERQIQAIQEDLYRRHINPVPAVPPALGFGDQPTTGRESLEQIERAQAEREFYERKQGRPYEIYGKVPAALDPYARLITGQTTPESAREIIEPWTTEPIRRAAGAMAGLGVGMRQAQRLSPHPLAQVLPWAGATIGEVGAEYIGEIAEGKEMEEALRNAAHIGKWSAGINFSLPLFSVGWQMTRRYMAARALGVPLNEADEWLLKFGEAGMPASVVDITNVPLIKGMRTILGKVPILSGPYKRLQSQQREALVAQAPALIRELNTMVPQADMAILGVNFADAAVNNSRQMLVEYVRAYKAADHAARVLGNNAVPTDAMKAYAMALAKEGNLPYLINRVKKTLPADDLHHSRVVDDYQITPMKGAKADAVQRFVAQWARLPERISLKHWRNIKEELVALQEAAATKGYRKKTLGGASHAHSNSHAQLIAELSDGVPVGKLAGMGEDAARVHGQRISNMYGYANRLFATAQNLWKTEGARPFKRIDKDFFSKQYLLGRWQGEQKLNPDKLFTVAYKTDSVQTLQQLRRLVGDENMARAWQVHWDNAILAAKQPTKGGLLPQEGIVINTEQLLQSVGLMPGGKVTSPAVLKEMLKGTGTTAREVENFVQVISKFGEIVSPAQMLGRSVALKGLPGITRMLGVGAMAAGVGVGVFKAVLMAGLLRAGGSAITNPQFLRNITKLGEMTLKSRPVTQPGTWGGPTTAFETRGNIYGTFSQRDISVLLNKEGIPAGTFMKLAEELLEQSTEIFIRKMRDDLNQRWSERSGFDAENPALRNIAHKLQALQ